MIISSNLVMNVATAEETKRREALAEVIAAVRRIRYGSVVVRVENGEVVQLEVTEKKRF